MNFFGIGLPEMAVIAAIGLLVFGPRRLPELGKTLGRTLRGFQSASQEFEKEFRNAIREEETTPAATAVLPTEVLPSEPVAPAEPAMAVPAEPAGVLPAEAAAAPPATPASGGTDPA